MEETCGVLRLHQLLGKKWSYGLFFALTENPKTFSELYRQNGRRINQSLLSSRLHDFVSLGLAIREDKEPHVFYSISKEGLQLRSLLYDFRQFVETLDVHVDHTCDKRCIDCPSYTVPK